eukprot:scpid95464/ scgid5066/ Phytanoyl-CoA dioxygenase domain-containing protein 1 homolog
MPRNFCQALSTFLHGIGVHANSCVSVCLCVFYCTVYLGTAEKRWHQDNAYFRLTPIDVMGCWIAIDPAFVQNGCMHVLSQSHGNGIALHRMPEGSEGMTEQGAVLYSLADIPDETQVTPLPMEPGDALLFHGALKHFTPPNRSNVE